jgi:hypothetical protein
MKESLRGIKFYEVVVYGEYHDGSIIIATYRDLETIKKLYADFKAKYRIRNYSVYSVTLKQIRDTKDEFFPIFVPELRMEFKDLQTMAESLMVYRLSGLMDKEI